MVGVDNGYDSDQLLMKVPSVECPYCGEWSALCYRPISWNANHDVYYTGEGVFLNRIENAMFKDEIQETKEAVRNSVHDWLDRREQHHLDDWHINLWIERDVEKFLVKILAKMRAGYRTEMTDASNQKKTEAQGLLSASE